MDTRLDPRLALLNGWQRDFPLAEAPFARIADAHGLDEARVLQTYRDALADGSLSRIGGVFAAGAGGAALLCAMAVPAARLDAVAAVVSTHPGVNHNYEREHRFNLWFVLTGRDAAQVDAGVRVLEAATGCAALRLPMRRAYRIDLGFDLGGAHAGTPAAQRDAHTRSAVAPADEPLAALAERGLPLVARPFDEWAAVLGRPRRAVLDTLRGWLARGTLRRFGAVVRHHEFGFAANAMTVFDVPDQRVDSLGARLARQAGVTLCYRRERAPGWPFNLYCMVHGRSRDVVHALLADAIGEAGLADCDLRVLFSRRRFKQQGARRFGAAPVESRGGA